MQGLGLYYLTRESSRAKGTGMKFADINEVERAYQSHPSIVELHAKIHSVLQQVGLGGMFSRPIHTLSGGQKQRLALAGALVSDANLLLLDEPTNHLDAAAVEWLQDWLQNYKGALVLVTHDRYVLDQVTNHMVEVDQSKTTFYEGNYTAFLTQKANQK